MSLVSAVTSAVTAVVVQIGTGYLVAGLISLVFTIFILVDMGRRPNWQWERARASKTLWIVLEVLLLLIFGPLAVIAGVIYLITARQRLIAVERQGPPPHWPGGGTWPAESWPPATPPGWPAQSQSPGAGPQWPPPGTPPPPVYPPGGNPPPYPPGAGAPPQPGTPSAPPYPGAPSAPPYPGTPSAPPYPGAPSAPPSAGTPQYPATGAPAFPGVGTPASAPTTQTSRPLFGWYPDPSGTHEKRYWDGTTWTEHVSDDEQRSIDPLPG
ncbi:MAG TPA: hypothetical protein VKR22_00895 [Acidimicrobiales bacterium]|nr:hypothetical protein [Acidimicrobiales bacterium]